MRSYSFSWKVTVLMLSNTLRRCAWIVWESDACPKISRRAGSDTKKKRGNTSRFFSRYPVRDFWQSSSCSSKWGSSCPRVSSPTQQVTTLGVSWAFVRIFTHDLSMLPNLLASCMGEMCYVRHCINIIIVFMFTIGSCLAMSPPTNTASRYTQRFCTTNQFSMISVEFESFCTHSWISFLNGALYLLHRDIVNNRSSKAFTKPTHSIDKPV